MFLNRIYCKVVIEYPLRDREVLGSNLPKTESHQTLKMALTASLCDAPHIKSLSKENNAGDLVKGINSNIEKNSKILI